MKNLLHLIIFYFVMFGCYLLEACFCSWCCCCCFVVIVVVVVSNERQKGSEFRGEGKFQGTGRSRGKVNYNQDILYEKIIYCHRFEKHNMEMQFHRAYS